MIAAREFLYLVVKNSAHILLAQWHVIRMELCSLLKLEVATALKMLAEARAAVISATNNENSEQEQEETHQLLLSIVSL